MRPSFLLQQRQRFITSSLFYLLSTLLFSAVVLAAAELFPSRMALDIQLFSSDSPLVAIGLLLLAVVVTGVALF